MSTQQSENQSKTTIFNMYVYVLNIKLITPINIHNPAQTSQLWASGRFGLILVK